MINGFASTANAAQKFDDFRAAFGGCDPKTSTHTPQMSRALRSRIPSLSCPVQKNGTVYRLSEKFFLITVEKPKIGSSWKAISEEWANI